MLTLLPILAQRRGDDDGNGWIFGLVFVAFWVLSAIASWLGKRQQEQRRRQAQQRAGRPVPPSPPPTPQLPQHVRAQQRILQQRQRALEQLRKQQQQQQQRPQRLPQPSPGQRPPAKSKQKSSKHRPVPAPPPLPIPTEEPALASLHAVAAPLPAPPTSAHMPNPWSRPLHRPATLRHQIVLAEILGKPVSLRDDDAGA